MFKLPYNIALILHTSKIMLKILQYRLQEHMDRAIPDIEVEFRKTEEPEIELPVSLGS